MKHLPAILLLLSTVTMWAGAQTTRPGQDFLESLCYDCHDAETKKGELDLTALAFDPRCPKVFATWVKVHDRVRGGEMPPKKKARPEPAERGAFLKALASR